MKHRSHFFVLCLAAFLVTGCDNTPVIEVGEDPNALVKENMINANRVVIQSEVAQIENYLQRRHWEADELADGLRLRVTQAGSGRPISPDDRVAVTYRLEGLDGNPFYTHQCDTLTVGRRDVTPALDEALERLHYGAKAVAVAPSNAAYGAVGDGDRVAARTVVVYFIEEISPLKSAK